MLAIERKRKIISLLEERNSVLVPELSKIFSVTEETVRRDLEKLEAEGFLKRTYGGAVINDSINSELPLKIREVTNIDGKRCIGIKVAEYINDGHTIMLDSSTTALQVAERIKHKKRITVITNSVKVVSELASAKDCKVISTGGTLREKSMSFVGHLTEDSISNFNVDVSIICCKGVDIEKGITESNDVEAEVKKAMTRAADKTFLVVDYTKFNKVSFIKMLKLEDVDMIFTDRKLSQEWEQFIASKNVELVYS
ncbi:DeoR/GlpR family DNA-binding transcription regulator [Clostridium lacusfryxellense]|uniref:DeoR/GlpR family DNA-binding transcription regulator n=1 Tax=Clostridium lacusfryxellense TaxID=205328 RepID=UPI001C0D5463|nr:DeoR/GlpR family DNA-binding transcription regulator [Clostridium lacusfryxellense]MBU3112769.1 DeoR/GlpR family DNA-binding transcription regulator [Clostridium lacusfryxellense]